MYLQQSEQQGGLTEMCDGVAGSQALLDRLDNQLALLQGECAP